MCERWVSTMRWKKKETNKDTEKKSITEQRPDYIFVTVKYKNILNDID
jgi:hypothetical protein